MGLFGLFSKKEKKVHKDFFEVTIKNVLQLSSDAIQVVFDIPNSLSDNFKFIAGQHIEIIALIDEKEHRRSYSICSGPNEDLSIAIKAIENGLVSNWAKNNLKSGDKLTISKPKGSFTLPNEVSNIVAIAAGSGITPIISIAKSIENSTKKMQLFYGNRTISTSIFYQELIALKNTQSTFFLSNEQNENFLQGRIDKENFKQQIKADLNLLKADAFFICGPEEMIVDISETLTFFGVNKEKIHFELFTPTKILGLASEVKNEFEGTSKVKVILDDEVVSFELPANGKSILEMVENEGLDAPFSCRGGVCSACKAKVIKGSAIMSKNFALTDEEVKNGYILTCQAHPSSEEITVSYDA